MRRVYFFWLFVKNYSGIASRKELPIKWVILFLYIYILSFVMKIIENQSLLAYNTFKIDVKSKFFVEIKSIDDLLSVLNDQRIRDEKIFVLWWGSNVLLLNDFDGLTIKNSLLWKEIIKENDSEIRIKVGAWEVWDDFVSRCVNANYFGLENLVAIPWSVGAAPMQNIWAYGVEAGSLVDIVEWFDLLKNEMKVLTKEECQFGYRDSVFKQKFKNKFIITSVRFKLRKVDENLLSWWWKFNINYGGIKRAIVEKWIAEKDLTLQLVADIIREIREWKLPDRHKIGTAWSFFKNPFVSMEESDVLRNKFPELAFWKIDEDCVKFSAGQLIDMAGLKWLDRGKCGVYKNHALILVNHGDASGQDVLECAEYIQACVKDKFGVDLVPEVNFVGRGEWLKVKS